MPRPSSFGEKGRSNTESDDATTGPHTVTGYGQTRFEFHVDVDDGSITFNRGLQMKAWGGITPDFASNEMGQVITNRPYPGALIADQPRFYSIGPHCTCAPACLIPSPD